MRCPLGALCILAWLLVPSALPGGQVAPDSTAPDSAAPDTLGLQVDRMVFCAAIKDKEPAGAADTFPSDIYAIYCFTRVVGASAPTSVKHVWYRGGKVVSTKSLPVKASPWRTWSLKEMRQDWTGEWMVEVVGRDSTVLASKQFVVK
jgi:hypothetical protein